MTTTTTANMGIRERLNNHKGATAGAIAAIVLVVLGVSVWQLNGNSSGASGARRGELYYTTDDGATTFTAPANLLPPFDHGGKPAVRAVMFSADGGKTKFVGYLERYTAAAKQQMEAADRAAKEAAKPGGKMVMSAPSRNLAVMEVKKPGDQTWVDKSSAAGSQMTKVTGPGGGAVEIVTP